MNQEENVASQAEHKHTLVPILIRNPDLFLYASRADIVVAHRCSSCSHTEPSPGWDGEERIRRNELCECCDGIVERTSFVGSQDMGRFQSIRIIYYYECKKCGHKQYYYNDEEEERIRRDELRKRLM